MKIALSQCLVVTLAVLIAGMFGTLVSCSKKNEGSMGAGAGSSQESDPSASSGSKIEVKIHDGMRQEEGQLRPLEVAFTPGKIAPGGSGIIPVEQDEASLQTPSEKATPVKVVVGPQSVPLRLEARNQAMEQLSKLRKAAYEQQQQSAAKQ